MVPMSMLNGAGLIRSKRTRVPFGVGVNCSAPLPPLTIVVSVPAPPSFRSVSSPGFQIIWSLPVLAEHLVVGVAAGQRVVAHAARQHVGAALAEKRVVAGLTNEGVGARAASERVVAVAADEAALRQCAVRLVDRDRVVAGAADHRASTSCWRRSASPPVTATAPPFTRMAARRVAAQHDAVVGWRRRPR